MSVYPAKQRQRKRAGADERACVCEAVAAAVKQKQGGFTQQGHRKDGRHALSQVPPAAEKQSFPGHGAPARRQKSGVTHAMQSPIPDPRSAVQCSAVRKAVMCAAHML